MNAPRRLCPPPPAHIAPFVQALGLDMAIRFILEFGGAELHLSADPKGRSEAEALVGDKGVEALAAHLSLPRHVPLAKPFLAAYFHARGRSTAEIARTLRATDVSVRRWLRQESARDERFR